MKKYKLVLFDLDGVLIDSKHNMELSWSAVRSVFELNVPFESYFKLIGRPFEDIMQSLGLGNLAGNIKKVYDMSSLCRIDVIHVYKDSLEVVRKIKENGVRIGIVTSKDRVRTLEIIKKMNILFDVVETPDGKIRGKPNPDPLFRAMLSCQMEPPEVAYVGDMDTDMECARRGGVDYIHVDWGYGHHNTGIMRASDPQDLLKLIS